jgi:hypothetical protein
MIFNNEGAPMFRIAAGLLLLTGCSVPLEGSGAGRIRPDVASERGPETRTLPFAGRTQQPGDATAPGGTGDLSDSSIPGRDGSGIPGGIR